MLTSQAITSEFESGTMEIFASTGNGCAMRVSPAGWVGETLQEVNDLAWTSSEITHHTEEAKAAVCAVAGAVYIARTNGDKEAVRDYVGEALGYDLTATPQDLHAKYKASSCMAAIPLAVRAFLEGKNFKDVLTRGILFGGDTDTIASIGGAIAEAYYGRPRSLKDEAYSRINPEFVDIIERFQAEYMAK